MRTMIFGAGSDLGVHIDGASLGPIQLMNDLTSFYQGESMMFEQDKSIIKSRNLSDRRKNEYEIEKFNTPLYKSIVEKSKEEYFPILIGGDHSVAVASALASAKVNTDVGIIWIDAHTDYNTFETTRSGNLHGLPLAAINGKCNDLTKFHNGNYYRHENTVLVGGRDIDEWEWPNINKDKVKVFTTSDIHKYGAEEIMRQAFQIAGDGTNGVHVSYDVDVIDPEVAPGVSVPAINGITKEEAIEIANIIPKYKDIIKSMDVVEFNPKNDIDQKTEKLAVEIINILTKIKED